MTKSSKAPSNNLDYISRNILPYLIKHKYAWPFEKPVDWHELQIPDYPKIVKYPIDLTSIRSKLRIKQYFSADDCISDIHQVFTNCYLFNQPGEDVIFMALHLDKVFKDRLRNLPGDNRNTSTICSGVSTPLSASTNHVSTPMKLNDLSSSVIQGKRKMEDTCHSNTKVMRMDNSMNEKHLKAPSTESDMVKCQSILKELMSTKYRKYNNLFMYPVDVKKLNLFDYFQIIKKPMDLSTAKSKIEAGIYESKDKFIEDVDLIINNCITYNGPNNECSNIAAAFHEIIKELIASTFSTPLTKPELSKPCTPVPHPKTEEKPHIGSNSNNFSGTQKRSPKNEKDKEKISQNDNITQQTVMQSLFKVENLQEDLFTLSKNTEQMLMSQSADIAELQRIIKECAVAANHHDQLENASMRSNISEGMLSSSASTASNSRKSKRQIRPPKNKMMMTPETITTSTPIRSNVKKPTTLNQTPIISSNHHNRQHQHRSQPLAASSVKSNHQRKSAANVSKVDTGKNNLSLKSKSKNDAKEDFLPMTYEEKRQLRLRINQLPSDKLEKVVQIINECEPQQCESDPEELEVDFETLQIKTLRLLDQFVDSVLKLSVSGRKPSQTGNSTTKSAAAKSRNSVHNKSSTKRPADEYVVSYPDGSQQQKASKKDATAPQLSSNQQQPLLQQQPNSNLQGRQRSQSSSSSGSSGSSGSSSSPSRSGSSSSESDKAAS